VVQGAPARPVELVVYVYVLEHPTEGLVLIDAGYGRRTAADPSDYPGPRQTKLLGLVMEPGAAAADRLPEAGLAADQVAHVIVTHMHSDHIGGLEDFPGAALHVTEAEWAARNDGGLLGKPDPRPFERHQSLSPIVWTEEPLGPFEAQADLFGDGSVIALRTPGHTAGHTSVLVNLPTRSYLITGDAAWTDPHWQAPALKSPLVRGLLEDDWKANWDSQWRIHAFAGAHDDVVVLSGHDARNLTRLPPWPAAAR
jgi:N-acyl homoserine lactone hydrolase